MQAWRPLLGGFALCVAAGVACSDSPIMIEVTLPPDLVDRAVWIEVGAYKGSVCNGISKMLTNGVPEGATARIAFKSAGKERPSIGEVPNGKYAFAAVARDESCTILAAGCKDVEEIDDVDQVTIKLSPTSSSSGQCANGTTCQAGMCVPANDNANASVGAGCSLELLGAGPLARPAGMEDSAGTMISAPAIAATSSGFLIAYRRVDPSSSSANLILMSVDTAGGTLGGALGPETPVLPDRCFTAVESDGIGLYMNGDEGRLTSARPACASKPSLELLNFVAGADAGPPTLGRFIVSPSPNDVQLFLSPARSTTPRPSGDLIVFTEGGIARIATIDMTNGIGGPIGSFGGTSGITNAWVAANEKILALLAAGPPSSTPLPPPMDAGTDGGDGGDDGGFTPPASIDAELRLLVLPSSTPVDSIDGAKNTPSAPVTFPGTFGSLATVGGRAIVMSGNAGQGEDVSFRAYDLGNEFATNTGGFSVEGDGNVTAGDVVVLGNRAYFVALKQHGIALQVYDNATTTLTALRDVSFARVPRISAINTVRDGRVAVVATPSRVAVVWTTTAKLDQYDSAGGYAVFACTK